jgi:hypothetical protein
MLKSSFWQSSVLSERKKPNARNTLPNASGDWPQVRTWMRMATQEEALAELEPRRIRSKRKEDLESVPGT